MSILLQERFEIPLAPVSINNFYYANKAHGIRSDARDWQHKMFFYLSQAQNAVGLERLRDKFVEGVHAYEFSIKFYVPAKKLMNGSGQLSSRAIDLSNCEKSILDVFCLPKHFDEPSPYGCKNLNIDDKHVIALTSRKVAGGTEPKMVVEVSIVPLIDSIKCDASVVD